MPGVLDGIRVIDWSAYHAGPAAASMLGDLGADVIKVEPLDRRDPMRDLQAFIGTNVMLDSGRQAFFEDLNRNKRAIALDLQTEEGHELMMRLIADADVFLTNYQPEAAAEVGLDPATLRKVNPRIICAINTTFGLNGPIASRAGFELTGYAYSGIMLASGEEGMPPIYVSPIGDRIGGVFLAYAVVAALLARERFGVGQDVTSSLLGGLLSLQSAGVAARLMKGEPLGRFTRTDALNPLYNYYRCADDRWVAVAALPSRRHWPAFCEALGCPELTDDERFRTDQDRLENRKALLEELERRFASRPAAEWDACLAAVDIPVAPVNSLDDIAGDPQALANRYIVEVDHPTEGRCSMLGFPVEFSETPLELSRFAPEWGEHTEEVLLELGLSWDDLVALKEQRVIV